MTPKLKALMVSLGIGLTITVGGLVSTREFWAPRIGVLDPALVDAGILLDCPLRNIRAWLVNPNGRMITQESKARVCNGEPVVSRLARDAIASGWRIYFVRDLGAATGSETELATVTDECRCSSGATCTAQRLQLNGTLAAVAALPNGFLAGPSQLYQNPAGAGCVAMPCVETGPSVEWPVGCPRP
jgi:hypothetical protein